MVLAVNEMTPPSASPVAFIFSAPVIASVLDTAVPATTVKEPPLPDKPDGDRFTLAVVTPKAPPLLMLSVPPSPPEEPLDPPAADAEKLPVVDATSKLEDEDVELTVMLPPLPLLTALAVSAGLAPLTVKRDVCMLMVPPLKFDPPPALALMLAPESVVVPLTADKLMLPPAPEPVTLPPAANGSGTDKFAPAVAVMFPPAVCVPFRVTAPPPTTSMLPRTWVVLVTMAPAELVPVPKLPLVFVPLATTTDPPTIVGVAALRVKLPPPPVESLAWTAIIFMAVPVPPAVAVRLPFAPVPLPPISAKIPVCWKLMVPVPLPGKAIIEMFPPLPLTAVLCVDKPVTAVPVTRSILPPAAIPPLSVTLYVIADVFTL
jgi:hypothetical protein